MKPFGLLGLALGAMMLTGCSHSWKEWADTHRRWCRATTTKAIPGARVVAYADTLDYPDVRCVATLEHEGRVYVVRANDSGEVSVTPVPGGGQ